MPTAIIQARMSSSRLPGKVLLELGQRPVLAWVLRAASESEVFDRIVVATSTEAADDTLVAAAASFGAEVVRGPHDDVLRRFVLAAGTGPSEPIARLTADCPLLDPALIRMCVSAFDTAEMDYLSTTLVRTLPRGLDVEVFSADALARADSRAVGVDRVHVTSLMYREPGLFRAAGLVFSPPSSDLRVTLDTAEDAATLRALVDLLGDATHSWRHVVAALRSHPEVVALNASVQQKKIEEG